jgi:DNA gyrase subunit B
MSEREFEDFFLSAWVETASLKVPGTKAPITGAPLLEMLRQVSEFRGLFGKFARRGVPAPVLNELLLRKFRGSKRGVGHEQIGEAVVAAAAAVDGYNVHVQPGETGEGHRVAFLGPQPTSFGTDIFKSPDYETLFALYETIAPLARGPLTIIEGGARERGVKGLDELSRTVLDLSKEGATFQRYKGLGEMNPEQLWETTMNPDTRTLLKVTMEDAVGADEMFTMLMGDAVEPRREFIEAHALDVANLDI